MKKEKIKVYDCFPFFNELELLEIRFKELSDCVDHFIICEATKSYNGKAKPLYYKENKERYKKWEDKITHLIYEPINLGLKYKFFCWMSNFSFMKNKICGRIYTILNLAKREIETRQRNYLVNGLKNAREEDLIFLSDVDEVWNKEKLPEIKQKITNNNIIKLSQDMYYYYLNGKATMKWESANVVKYSFLKNKIKKPDYIRNLKISERILGPLFKIRPYKKKQVLIKNGGWHFSYLGGEEKVRNKIENTTHFEHNSEEKKNKVKEMVNKGMHIGDPNVKIKYIKINKTFPKTIKNNLNKYKHLIK